MFTSIQFELKELFAHLEKDYCLKSGHLSKFIPGFNPSCLDTSLRPALLVLSAKVFKGYNYGCMMMAGVVELIHLAQDIHNQIPDECPKDVPQFPVLVGDYLFSKFFKKLSDHNLLEWLAPLASVICKMNEGGTIRREVIEHGRGLNKDYLDVLLMEYGLLTGLACKIGGSLAGCNERQADALEQFGLNLGMAWGVIKEKYPLVPGDFLNIARKNLLKISMGQESKDMMDIIDEFEVMASNHLARPEAALCHAL
ncbi:MAG: polyprenyl synthetase family protein [Bacillota bacterium]|jgi:octaprenyl-diphosphate synthase